MKRLVILFLTLIIAVTTSGFTQYIHMCKATGIVSHSFTNLEKELKDKPCPICSEVEKSLNSPKKDCCKHDAKIIKVDDSVKKQLDYNLSVKFWGEAIPNKMLGTVFDPVSIDTEKTKHTFYSSTKIPTQGVPIYILNCVYRI